MFWCEAGLTENEIDSGTNVTSHGKIFLGAGDSFLIFSRNHLGRVHNKSTNKITRTNPLLRRFISHLLIFCLTFSQVAQAYTQAWLPHRPPQHFIDRTDTLGSTLTGDSVNITSGRDINITGSNVSAEHDISVAAMGNVNIAAATDTYGSDHYSHETTTGLQIDGFNITDIGPETTSKARTDGSNQSENRSSLGTNSGKLTIMAGGNLVAQGADLAAKTGAVTLAAANTIALLAGQDTLNQSSSTVIASNPNFFTKQHYTLDESSNSLVNFGSTLNGEGLELQSGADIILQAADIKAGPSTGSGQATGGIALDAGGDLLLLAAADTRSSTRHETLSTDGMSFGMDGGFSDRRKNNLAENQTTTQQLTTLASAGDIDTRSGGDTRIEASQFQAQGAIDINAERVTLAAVKDSTYVNVADSHNSSLWQSASGHGEVTETLKLANISAGEGLTVNAAGGIETDIPEVKPAVAPAQYDEKGKLIPPVPPTAEEQAAQRQAALGQQLETLAKQPGQEWIAQLAKQNNVKYNEVKLAAEHWDYSHEGLTPEAAAVVVVVVAYFTAGAASGAGTSVAGATGSAAAGAATTAAVSTLASQAAVSFLNNKGNIGKTLDDLGKSENVKAMVTAMVTAGVLQGLNTSLGIEKVNAQSSFPEQLQKNLINQSTSTVLNHAIYGGDLQQQLEQSLKSAFIDTGAAQGANLIGNMKVQGDLDAFTHKLAHAIAGCAAGAARAGDCSSGALGAVVGEISAELYGGDRSNDSIDQPGFKTDTVNFARMMAGIAVAITGGDAEAINLAAAAGGNAAENNWLNHADEEQLKKLKQLQQAGQCDIDCEKSIAGLELLDKVNNRELLNACVNGTAAECKAQVDRYPAALKYEVDNFGKIVLGRIFGRSGDHSKEALASLGQALEKTQLKPLVDAQGVVTGWAVDLGGSDPETLRYWLGAGVAIGTVIILPTSALELIPGAGKGMSIITRGTERLVVEEATGKVLGKIENAGGGATPNVADTTQELAKANAGRSPYSEINGSLGELNGYKQALNDGRIGVVEPGKASAPGVDYATFDPETGVVYITDAKYRAPGGTYPSAIPQSKVDAWTQQVKAEVQG